METDLQIPILGRVTKDKRFNDYVSEPRLIPFLRNHACRFVLLGYEEDRRQDDFHQAIKNVLAIDDSVLSAASSHILRYRREMLSLHNASDLERSELKKPDDAWQHVQFGSTIYVSRREDGDDEDGVYLSLECNCDWEEEHGLQIVLRDGRKITKVGPFDGHLTNSDAFDDSSFKKVVYVSIHHG